MLISSSVDQVLDQVHWEPLREKKVFLDEKYIECVDKAYVIGSIRHRIAHSGGQLVAKADAADIVLEVRSGGVGTDSSDMFVGMPGITLPGMLSLPEVRLLARQTQTGTAKLGIVAYDAKTMRVLGEGGVSLSQSTNNNWFFLARVPTRMGQFRGRSSDPRRWTAKSTGKSFPSKSASTARLKQSTRRLVRFNSPRAFVSSDLWQRARFEAMVIAAAYRTKGVVPLASRRWPLQLASARSCAVGLSSGTKRPSWPT